MSLSPYEPWETPPPQDGFPNAYDPYGQAKHPHSGLGTASFILGIIALVLMGIPFGYGVYLAIEAVSQGLSEPQIDETAPMIVVAGCASLLGILAALVGLGLGIAALFQSERKKWPAITGLVLCGGLLLFMAAAMLIQVGAGAP